MSTIHSIAASWKIQIDRHYQKQAGRLLRKFKMELPYDPGNSILGRAKGNEITDKFYAHTSQHYP